MIGRRTYLSYLSLLGIGSLAGCTGGTEPNESTPSGSSTSSPIESPEPTDSTTEAVETGVPEPTSKDATPETTSEEPTTSEVDSEPTDEELAERHVSEAKKLIESFFDNWAASTVLDVEDPSIIHVFASTTEFRRSSITDPLFEAEEELKEARALATFDSEQYNQIMAMREELDYLMMLSKWQENTVNAYAEIEAQWAIYSGESSGITHRIERVSESSEKLDAVRKQREGLELVFAEVSDSKLEQAEVETELIGELNSAVGVFLWAKASYEDERYSEATDRAGIARRDLRDIAEEVGTPSSYPPTDTTDERFLELTEQWEDEADSLERRAAYSA